MQKQKIIFATKNDGKLTEINKILADFNIISMVSAGYDIDIKEDGQTYRENAAKKAQALVHLSGLPVLADDSGIEIDFFDGQPGVHSSTFLTTNEYYKERNKKILGMMKNTANRRAKYVCTVTLFLPGVVDGYFTTGELAGSIATYPDGANGFAYDEIFYVEQYNATLAKITTAQKNKISHRNIALQKMRILLQTIV
ncbi:MAG: RdgB/HAM1 family non-canonical purine NTP pyrophosphatase [Defluviitaleaceae bacterium]|nr:RdgB/HAM1 family non-canonical purine NTP pyrophosphatase [Defluviitaleaceae bacterium]